MSNTKKDSSENQEKELNKPIFEASKEKGSPNNQPNPDSQEENPPIIEEVAPDVDIEKEDTITPSLQEEDKYPKFEEDKSKYIVIILSTLFFFLFLFLIFKFISKKGNISKQPITLTYWMLWEDENAFKPLIQEYEKKHSNIKIKFIQQTKENYLKKLITRSKNGNGPDIFRFHNTWVPELKEVLSPLPKEIFPYSLYKKTFYPICSTDLKVGNYYYGIPLEIDGLILIYNKDMFDDAGIPSPPTTWDELIDTASKLTIKDKEGNIIRSGLALGTASNIEHFSDIFGWMLLQNGGTLKQINNSQGVDTLEAYRALAEPPTNLWDEKMPNSLVAFVQGKVAMIFAPSWEVLVIKAQNPEINVQTTTLPTLPGGTKVALANYWVEGVSRYSKNQIEGWKFLRFLSEKESLTKLYAEESKEKLFGEPYPRVDLASLLTQNTYLKPVIEQASYYKSIPLISRTYDDGLNDTLISYLRNAINSTIEGVNYKAALDEAQKGIQQVFNQYGIN